MISVQLSRLTILTPPRWAPHTARRLSAIPATTHSCGVTLTLLRGHAHTTQALIPPRWGPTRPNARPPYPPRRTPLQAHLCKHTSASTPLQAHLSKHTSPSTPLQAHLSKHTSASTPLQAHHSPRHDGRPHGQTPVRHTRHDALLGRHAQRRDGGARPVVARPRRQILRAPHHHRPLLAPAQGHTGGSQCSPRYAMPLLTAMSLPCTYLKNTSRIPQEYLKDLASKMIMLATSYHATATPPPRHRHVTALSLPCH